MRIFCIERTTSISFDNSLIKQVAADLKVEMPGLKTFITLSPLPRLVSWLEAEGHDYDPGDDERMKRLAAFYLLMAKHEAGGPLDPAARLGVRQRQSAPLV